MNTSTRQPADVWHIVGNLQHWLSRLGVKVPRALCGISLAVRDGDAAELPTDDAPVCPKCARRAGWPVGGRQ